MIIATKSPKNWASDMSKSKTLWWPRYVGDYQRKTAHLSLLEHGAYVLLLDHYYSTNQPLPANAAVLHRVCRAFASDEQAAVNSIIEQFFQLEVDGYHNRKADEQILKRGKISEIRTKAAKIKHNKKAANAPAYAHANAPAYANTSTARVLEDNRDKSLSPSNPLTPKLIDDGFKQFMEFWEGWIPFNMPKGSKQGAVKSYIKALKEIDHAALITRRDQYLENCRNLRSKTKHASSWLNGRGWENDDATGAITTAGGGGHGTGKSAGGKTAGQLALEDRTYG